MALIYQVRQTIWSVPSVRQSSPKPKPMHWQGRSRLYDSYRLISWCWIHIASRMSCWRREGATILGDPALRWYPICENANSRRDACPNHLRNLRCKTDEWAFGLMQNTSTLKIHRRLFEKNFRASVIQKYETHQIWGTVRMLENLFDDPSDFLQIIHQHVNSQSVNVIPHWNLELRCLGSVIECCIRPRG